MLECARLRCVLCSRCGRLQGGVGQGGVQLVKRGMLSLALQLLHQTAHERGGQLMRYRVDWGGDEVARLAGGRAQCDESMGGRKSALTNPYPNPASTCISGGREGGFVPCGTRSGAR